MQNEHIALILLFAAAIIGVIFAVSVSRKRSHERSAKLREAFGPEYDRAVSTYGRGRAERELESRQKRLDAMHIRLLSADQCARFADAWTAVQQRFVDEPSVAVTQADALVKEVMQTRGYPMANFEQRVADLSVDHASVVDHYRAARMLGVANPNGAAGTEDLRQAMVHYRALFNDLLETQVPYTQLQPART